MAENIGNDKTITTIPEWRNQSPAKIAIEDLITLLVYMFIAFIILFLSVFFIILIIFKNVAIIDAFRISFIISLSVPLFVLGSIFIFISKIVAATIERIIGWDINNDGVIGFQSPQILKIELVKDDGKSLNFMDLHISIEELQTIAKLAIMGRLTERDIQGKINYRAWQQAKIAFLQNQLLEWKNPREPRSGLKLTEKGREFFQRVLQEQGQENL
jgi:hypothetical protein